VCRCTGEAGAVEHVLCTVPIFDERKRGAHNLAPLPESTVENCFELFDDIRTIRVSKPALQSCTSQEGFGQDALEFPSNTVGGIDLLKVADGPLERETPP
jgi:hypothetical protein